MKKYYKYKMVLLMIVFIQFILALNYLWQYRVQGEKIGGILVLIVISGIILDVAIWYLLKWMIDSIEMEEKISELYEQRQNEWDYGKMVKEHMDTMQEMCDMFETKIAEVYELMDGEGTDESCSKEAEDILKSLEKAIEAQRMERYCEHEVLNALLTAKKQSCGQQGLSLKTDCNVSRAVKVEEIDLCSLFSNMINAGTLASAILNNPDGEILLKADMRSGRLAVRLEERVKEECSDKNIRKKLWCRELALVEVVCQRYDGLMEMECKDGRLAIVAVI